MVIPLFQLDCGNEPDKWTLIPQAIISAQPSRLGQWIPQELFPVIPLQSHNPPRAPFLNKPRFEGQLYFETLTPSDLNFFWIVLTSNTVKAQIPSGQGSFLAHPKGSPFYHSSFPHQRAHMCACAHIHTHARHLNQLQMQRHLCRSRKT